MSSAQAIQDAVIETLPGTILQTAGIVLEKGWPLLLLALFGSLLSLFLRSAKVKGHIGETIVSVGALRRLDPKVYRVFNDLVLPRPDGKGTTQIDHVVVSPFGIFVIETKNYGGWIFGDEDSRYWTQTIYRKKSRFQNPLHQNALHVRALAIATGLSRECFHNLVYFVGGATLKTPLPQQVMTKGLVSFIRAQRDVRMPPGVLDRVFSILDGVVKGGREHQPLLTPPPPRATASPGSRP